MLQSALAVVVIPPHGPRTSEGVATELEMLAELQLPVLVLQWDYPRAPFEDHGVNVVYSYQVHGSAPNDRWIAGASRQLAEVAWLAWIVRELRTKHAPAGDLILDALPAFGSQPITSFRLTAAAVIPEDHFLREVDSGAIAASVVGRATEADLAALIEKCWADAEPALQYLRKNGHGPVRRPCAALHDAMHAVVEHARKRFPALSRFSADALQRRGIAFTRFDNYESAVDAFTEALVLADRHRSRVYAARALAHDDHGELPLALDDMDTAVAEAEDSREECVHRYTRAVFRTKLKTPDAFRSALHDYDRIVELNLDHSMRLNALNNRALTHARLGDVDAALTDWKSVIDAHADAPRAAAQACLNRAGHLRQLGRLPEALDDLTTALDWADVSSTQRFRALEARAQVREALGDLGGAAADVEALLALDLADPEWRPELKEKVRSLRQAAADANPRNASK